MNRLLLLLAILAGGSCFGATLINASVTEPLADEAVTTVKGPVGANRHEASSAAGRSMTGDKAAEQSGSSIGSQRDYRRELQYDKNILEIRSQLHGVAKPQKNAVMSSLVAGRVMTLHVAEGAQVAAGDKLVSLDDRLLVAQVEAARIEAERVGVLQKAEAVLQQTERRFKRMEQAALKVATATFEIQEAQAQMDQARAEHDAAKEAKAVAGANLKLAEEQLHRNTVFAPFDGVVIQLHQKVGVTVDPSLPVVTIADLSTLEVDMYVPVDRFGSFHAGSDITLKASAPVNRNVQAVVRSVSPVIDSASNTFRCVMTIDNSTGELPAGFSVWLGDVDSASTPVAHAEE